MKIRAAKFVAAIIASLLSSASAFAAPEDAAADNAEAPAEQCLTSPRDYAPPGTRWRYRLERGSGRHCWFLKDDADKSAGKAAGQSAAAAEETATAPSRKRSATSRSVTDARAELSQPPVQAAPVAPAPAASAPAGDPGQPSAAKGANMLAPAAATRWPEPMSTLSQASPAANPTAPPAAPAEQGAAEARTAPAASPPAKPQVMPRAVPPLPVSEKPISLPMLITIIAGGLSVMGVLASLLLAWIASRRARLSPTAPMPPLESPETPRRPGDLYRERKRTRAQKSRRRAA